MAIDDRFSDVDKPIIILDFRDHDPSGLQMTEDLEKRLVKYGDGHDIKVSRIALTIDQVKAVQVDSESDKAGGSKKPGIRRAIWRSMLGARRNRTSGAAALSQRCN